MKKNKNQKLKEKKKSKTKGSRKNPKQSCDAAKSVTVACMEVQKLLCSQITTRSDKALL